MLSGKTDVRGNNNEDCLSVRGQQFILGRLVGLTLHVSSNVHLQVGRSLVK